jgi:hypothetical protein
VFDIDDCVRLAEPLRGGTDAVGTVVGFVGADVLVRWGSAFEAALAPASLEHVCAITTRADAA